MGSVLIVDDDPSLRDVLEIALTRYKHKALAAADIKSALVILGRQDVDLVLLDLRLGQENGLDLLRMIRERWPNIPVLMVTAHADSRTAVEAMKLGARDYISKPFDVEEFLLLVQRTLETSRLAEENAWLKEQIEDRYGPIVGQSPKMAEVFNLVDRLAPTPINVLITGESGTGKELIARAIHNKSPRKNHPLMVINCGGLPENLVESELFGFRKGAFTGADRAKKGLLEMAEGGTVFLDEVAEMHLSTQVKLLRCIQDGTFIPLGSTEEVHADVRIIAATNRPVEEDVATGRFREDLFYRLSGVIIKMPPLRERGKDILLLADHFLTKACAELKRDFEGFTPEAQEKLMRYHYPGNVRELENLVERAVALETGKRIHPGSLIIYEQVHPETPSTGPRKVLNGELSLEEYLEREEQKIMQAALERTGGHKGKAAELVGLNFRQFRYRLSKLDSSEGEEEAS
ncbi:MAG: sigma-54-dependent transcriptional regulator [Desulfohalobiaceae bacterium]